MIARWIAVAVALSVASRLLLDVCVQLPTRIDGVNVAQMGTLVCLLIISVAAVFGVRRWPHVAWGLTLGWAVIVGVGWWRSGAHGASAAALRYASGPLVALAVAGTWRTEARRVWSMATVLFGGAVALVAIAQLGSAGWVQLHDTWRYVGPFDNLHALALGMGLVLGVGVVVSTDARRPPSARVVAALTAGLTFVPLAASATRSGVVLAATVVVTAWLVRGRWRWTAAAIAGTLLATALVPGLRHRSAELVLALVGVAPEEGWVWLGTGRIAIWTRSLSAFRDLPGTDQAFGMGLAGYELFWKGKEPHSEYLALLYQFGPVGPLWFALTAVTAGRRLWQARHQPVVPLLLGVLVATMVTSVIGSTLLVRLTVSWAFWVAVGCAWGATGALPTPPTHRDRRPGHAAVSAN